MKHLINPTIDCVFKAILGATENTRLLIHFLNGILSPPIPITDVTITNPYNEKKFLTDKLTIVDIKAKDALGTVYQIEVQLSTPGYLRNRMAYTWSDIYQQQLSSGQLYPALKPVISIWLLTENVFTDSEAFHHHFQLFDQLNQQLLTDHCSIHVLELKKWQQPADVGIKLAAADEWLYFFKEAEHWDKLPGNLNSPEMRKAMEILEQFSEREEAYHLYQARQNFIREQKTVAKELEDAKVRADAEAARADDAKVRADAEAARADKAEEEKEKLVELLRKAGIDPEAS
ncbi:MAG: putative transposase/invertase (TIGR01784 family) [Phenylobacterium sp.]|jgi:predicted transposase/invertase (TIGR01784 family)